MPETIAPVMIDLISTALSPQDEARLAHPLVGGVILFSRNFSDVHQLAELVESIRRIRPKLIIAVDHEGGRVQRFKNGFSLIPAMETLGSLYDQDQTTALSHARELGWLMAAELRAFDIDISFAPVLDRNHGVSQVIGDRAFSTDLSIIQSLASAFMDGMHDAGMANTGKHFPGHGAVVADSHIAIPIDDRPFNTIVADDMAVFGALALKGLDAVMPAHVIYSKVDKHPAGFSTKWIQDILRQQLEFDGVVFSDDLSMEGASVAGSFTERANAALNAGCDMILVCNNPDAADEVLSNVDCTLLNTNSASRLERMQGREFKLTFDELKLSERWLAAQTIIAALSTK